MRPTTPRLLWYLLGALVLVLVVVVIAADQAAPVFVGRSTTV